MLNCFSCNAEIVDTLAAEPCLCDSCIADINAADVPKGWDEIEGDDEPLDFDDDDFTLDDSDVMFEDFDPAWSEYEEYLDAQEAKAEYQGIYAHDLHLSE